MQFKTQVIRYLFALFLVIMALPSFGQDSNEEVAQQMVEIADEIMRETKAYGDAKDARGNIRARAWCEAVVQRVIEPIVPDATNLDPEPDITKHPAAAFGRKFKIITFRWLSQNEI